MIRSGSMRHRLRIEKPATAQDGYGQPLPTWTLVAEVWASLERTPGSEVWAAAARQARVPVLFRIRYRDDVAPNMRAVLGSQVHDIKSVVDPSGKRAELLLSCEELVGDKP